MQTKGMFSHICEVVLLFPSLSNKVGHNIVEYYNMCGHFSIHREQEFKSRIRQYKNVNKKNGFFPLLAWCTVAPFCMNMYLDMVNTTGGAIAWAFLKPMLMGQILYTPDTPVTRGIMEKVCSTSGTNSHIQYASDLICPLMQPHAS